jgi:energy coupling factor transporter S component ThiW
LFAVIGEVIGTGIIGSIVSYPVMKFLVGKGSLSLFFYTPMFLTATLMGGSVAYLFLTVLKKNNMLKKFQEALETKI